MSILVSRIRVGGDRQGVQQTHRRVKQRNMIQKIFAVIQQHTIQYILNYLILRLYKNCNSYTRMWGWMKKEGNKINHYWSS